jgi:Asp-tRNA(Asn)/Glu-tRNA(Gln) amidotransferase C subunit
MYEKNRKNTVGPIKTFVKKKSIQDEQIKNVKNKITQSSTLRTSPKSKRGSSQLEIGNQFQFNSENSLNKSSSRQSLNIKHSSERENDELANTFQNMFNHFSKLTEIMTNSTYKQPETYRKSSNTQLRKKSQLDYYEPLTYDEKMRYLNEISKGSESRMNAYTTIFNTIKSQISLISKRDEENDLEKELICNSGRNKASLMFNKETFDSTDKNVNIINNNITVNIINSDSKVDEKEISSKNYTQLTSKDKPVTIKTKSAACNLSITYNDEILEDENKNILKNQVVASNTLKNKIDLEKHSPFNINRKCSNKLINPHVFKKLNLNLLSSDDAFPDLETQKK